MDTKFTQKGRGRAKKPSQNQKQKGNSLELVFILDRSGSMHGLEADTIGGFNSLIEKQKKLGGDCRVSMVQFNDRTKLVLDRMPLERVRLMRPAEFSPSGSTALYDAIGKGISAVMQKQLLDEKPMDKTMFVIITDGEENSSVQYSPSRLKRMIRNLEKKQNWEFLFIGANMDAAFNAEQLGIREDRAASYHSDSRGTQAVFHAVTEAVCMARVCPSDEMLQADWRSAIEEDNEGRHA